MINKDILRVAIVFVALFFALMVYLVIFLSTQRSVVINNTYNKRSDTYKRIVKRGSIYDADGNILARTDLKEDGTEVRVYPYGATFAQVVGFEANGSLGLESSYNYYLLTSHENVFTKIKNEFNGKKNPGDSIHTTLRADFQEYVSELLGDTAGACIALNPQTGEIYVDVSKPDFDPNDIEEQWDEIIKDEEGSPLLNRVTQGRYTPGSTFKMFTLLEYMRENPTYYDYTYRCEGAITGPNFKSTCYGGQVHGDLDLTSSFTHSCNCSFAHIGLLLDRAQFQQNNEALLFNSKIDIDIASNPSDFHISDETSDFMMMQTSFGQGETSTNPLHLAMVMSAFANEGVLMKPHFVTHIESASGKKVKTFANEESAVLCTAEEAARMNTYLRSVVTEGTANVLAWADYTAYGKTGTAETLSNKNENIDRSWFVGYGEMGGEKLVVCVIVDNADAAPMDAATYTKNIFDYYFY